MNISNIISIILISLLIPVSMMAQEENDPRATTMMDIAKSQLERLEDYSFDFKLTTKRESGNTIQEGTYTAMGDKYSIDLGTIQAFSDGVASYVLKNNKQDIEIYDIDKSESIDLLKGPSSILGFYKTGTFVYQLVTDPGSDVQNILFKPIDKEGEFVKISLLLNKENELQSCQVYMRDASNVLLQVSNFKSNTSVNPSMFEYDVTNYPGANVEDLRY